MENIEAIFAPFCICMLEGFLFMAVDVQKRVGVVGIVIESPSAVEDVNSILHEFAGIIVGRMGIPYRERGVAIISIIVDGTTDEISALTGRLGRVKQVSVKTALAKEMASVSGGKSEDV